MPVQTVSVHHLTELLGEWRDAAGSEYAALAERIRLLTIDGRINVGMRLPSERQLAEHLGVSRTTVNSAIEELRRAGYARSRQGSGTVIAIPGRTGEQPIPGVHDLLDLSRATAPAAPGVHAAAERALAHLPARLITDGYELSGLPALRELLAENYTDSGVPTSPAQILVTNGGAGAISLIARTLVATGDRVLVETPGYPHSNDAFRVVGARLIPTIVDGDDGWDVTNLTQTFARSLPTVAYLMPDFHNPTSRTMTAAAREATVSAAEHHGTIIVADETMADLDIDRGRGPAPLAAFDTRGSTVISVGSASKTIWGGLRVGWLRASEDLINRLYAARFSYDLGVGVFDQLTVVEALTDFAGIVAYRRRAHLNSRGALANALQHYLPGARMHRVEGGVAAWIDLDETISSALAIAARSHGLLIGAGPWFGLHGEFERNIRIPITASPDDVVRGVAILAKARRELPKVSRHPRHLL